MGHSLIRSQAMISRSALLGSAILALAAAQEAPLLTTALEVVSRASTSSEVLSLNLTNLIILIALKVAIIVFGLVSGGATGRSSEEQTSVTPADLAGGMCFLLYTGGDEEKLSCVARAACESPVAADNYLAAAKMWYKMHKLIQAVPFSEKYNVIMETLYDASEHAKAGGHCSKYNW